MSESDQGPPRRAGWRWYHILGIVLLSLIGMASFAAWRINRAIHEFTGGSAAEFLRDPMAAMERGILVTLQGDVPGSPRRARIALVRGAPGDSTSLHPELRLEDALPDDSAAAWAGRCVAHSTGDTLRIVIGAARTWPTDSEATKHTPLSVMSAGRSVGALQECADEDDDAGR